MRNIAVIGAGMAGCTLARRLVDGGFNVHVFDKGRAAGGRMATRIDGRLRFDHGAQFMSVRGDGLANALVDWRRAGVVAPWPQAAPASGDGGIRWVGVPGMNALAPRLLWGAEVRNGTTVSGIGTDALGWWLTSESGRQPDCFDAVLVTIPAPQAVALFETCAGVDALPFADAMRRIRYAPCWALMLSFDVRLDAVDCVRFQPGGVLGWAARDSSKPQRDAASECWVIHADPHWSADHVELSPAQAATLLFDAFAAALEVTVLPVHQVAHRWRHARVIEALGRECLWDGAHRLGYASDGCLGERLEDAFDSANALAERVLQTGAGGG